MHRSRNGGRTVADGQSSFDNAGKSNDIISYVCSDNNVYFMGVWMEERISSEYGTYRESLFNILDFYVLNTPVPKTSRRGLTFTELGWSGGKVNTLQALMRRGSSIGVGWICDKQTTIQAHLERLQEDGKLREHAVYAKGGSKGRNDTKTSALFYGIRCAFAHGSFRIFEDAGVCWYELENRNSGKVRGHFLLKETTLHEWMELVRAGPNSSLALNLLKRKRNH